MISSKALIDQTGISRATLNNYIQLGILPKPVVQSLTANADEGGARVLGFFPDDALERVQAVQILKSQGLSMAQVAERLAQTDTLTGLPNRTLFVDRLQRAILKARREKGIFALLFIDVDRFKSINDQFGHSAGDEVLKACCNRMIACIRDSDSLGRIGGDEFVLLLEDLHSAQDAMEIAKKIKAAVEVGVSVSGELISTTVSIGIALYPVDSNSEEGLFKRADLAMYKSKQSGRNTISLNSDVVS